MARGLDELIDWLVAETAYCGETGLSATDFVAAVGRFYAEPLQNRAADGGHDEGDDASLSAQDPSVHAANDGADMPLARQVWEWLVERPEILVGRGGCRGRMSLDDVLALPEPQPVGAQVEEDKKIDTSSAALASPSKAKKQVSFAQSTKEAAQNDTESRQPRRVSAAARAAAAAAAAAPEDPSTQPRLYATERTIWYTLTGHDVDYKKIPPLEWKCLMCIASARKDGILQGDLRARVGQDKRSVPKRTDFLAAKGYAVKRTTIARTYRTSMLWLTEFAPADLDADIAMGAAGTAGTAGTAAVEDHAGNLEPAGDIDFSPDFLRQNLDPVPWRNRWIGDAIEFASFGQTILAIVKAWGVIRVVDLKVKLGIYGLRWQMRTLARVCREFVASGILRFVAAMRQDERKLFKDCIRFERDPTPAEWSMYLAAGRRRMPITEVLAKHRRLMSGGSAGSGRTSRDASVIAADGDESTLGSLGDFDDYDYDEDDLEGAADPASAVAARGPAWVPGTPLINLVYETVKNAGVKGVTSPEICRLTVGSSYSRYMFSLINALARPGNQPPHLARFQLRCEPDRIGKNKAYLFRTLENAQKAERLAQASGEASLDALGELQDQDAAAAAGDEPPAPTEDEERLVRLHTDGKLADLPPDELKRLFGFAPAPPPISIEEATKQLEQILSRQPVRPKKIKGALGGAALELDEEDEQDEQDQQDEPDEPDDEPAPPKRKRGRPKKIQHVEEPTEAADVPDEESAILATEPEVDAGPVPMVRFGQPNSLEKKAKTRGRKKRSIVLIFRLEQLKDAGFLSEQKGYKEGALRELEEDSEPDRAPESEEHTELDADFDAEEAPPHIPVELEPVVSHYNGQAGTLTVDQDSKTLLFTYSAPRRRGRQKAKAARDPISISIETLVNDPIIRDAPGSDDQALILEVREAGEGREGGEGGEGDESGAQEKGHDGAAVAPGDTVWPFVFILDDEAEDNDKHAAALRDVLVSLRPKPRRPKETDAAPKKRKRGRPSTVQSTDPPPNTCEKCHKSWKNLLGLQYHQTKARTPCNPDYVPPSPSDPPQKRQRKQKSVADAETIVVEEEGGEKETDEQNAGGTSPPRPRRQLRERKPATKIDQDISLSMSDTADSPPFSPAPEKAASKRTSNWPARARRRLRAGSEDAEGPSRSSGLPLLKFRGITGASKVGLVPTRDLPPPPRSMPTTEGQAYISSLSSYANTPRASMEAPLLSDVPRTPLGGSDADTAAVASRELTHNITTVASSPAATTIASTPHTPSVAPAGIGRVPPANTYMPSTPVDLSSQTPAPSKFPAFQMPPLAKNLPKVSAFIMRSQRTMEIIKYLIACYDGVFPSDRSLWYACFTVYTKAFPGQDPPTLNVVKASIKKLEVAKVVEEHTFGFRDARSQFIYCRLVARPGTDLFHSEVGKMFKANIQAVHPKPFVPPEFTPSEKDMAILRILDKHFDNDTPRNTKGRRPLAPEIEVLNGPVYENYHSSRPPIQTVIVDYDDDDDEEEDEEGQAERKAVAKADKGKGKKPDKSPGRKRKAAPMGDGVDAAGDVSGSNTPARKRKAKFADFIAGKAEGRWSRTDSAAVQAVVQGKDGADDEANIDPMLRTVQTKPKPRAKPRAKREVNPGLDTLPAHFFLPGATKSRGGPRSKAKPAHLRMTDDDSLMTFAHFLPPNSWLEEGEGDNVFYGNDKKRSDSVAFAPRPQLPPPRAYKMVTKTFTLADNGNGRKSWPVVTETLLQRHSDSSITMDGFMPTRKALLRDNLPRSPAECAAMLRGNVKLGVHDSSPMGVFSRDIEYCRSWELSQMGTDTLSNPSVAPKYVFLNVRFPGAHTLAEPDSDANKAAEPQWRPEDQYTVDTIPYGKLDQEAGTHNPESATAAVPASPAVARRQTSAVAATGAATGAATAAASAESTHTGETKLRGWQARKARQAKYVMNSRRDLTAFPQKPEDYIIRNDEADSAQQRGDIDWKSDQTCLAALIAVKVLLGGLGQMIDWGIMMRLFPDRKVSDLRTFWLVVRKKKQQYIDKFTERFQQAYVEAYGNGSLPSLDYDDILAYDWAGLVAWTVELMRRSAAITLPATRAALDDNYALVDMTNTLTASSSSSLSIATGWREDYYHVSRSVWNRLQDSAFEAASRPLDTPLPTTPAEAAAAALAGHPGAHETLRFLVAQSWIRSLCGTPHDRYQPSLIKDKLLTLGSVGVGRGDNTNGDQDGGPNSNSAGRLDEAETNSLLQTVIGSLTKGRVLRRSKSMISVGGRMYQMAEAYETTLEKTAMEDKFRQAWAFKEELDARFRLGGPAAAFEMPVDANNDGMIMAVINLQAHGRVVIEAIDAPYVPFGFEPGNYESRKFPKHHQRFRQRIVPTERYVYNDDAELAERLRTVASASRDESRDESRDGGSPASVRPTSPPQAGAYGEKPIWRDFFGLLDQYWFVRLASAVVFSLATRGATPPKQTAAHLRPIIEPFEVQMIMEWATGVGILDVLSGSRTSNLIDSPPNSGAVTEWWWLLVAQMYAKQRAEEKTEKAATGVPEEEEDDDDDEEEEDDEYEEDDIVQN